MTSEDGVHGIGVVKGTKRGGGWVGALKRRKEAEPEGGRGRFGGGFFSSLLLAQTRVLFDSYGLPRAAVSDTVHGLDPKPQKPCFELARTCFEFEVSVHCPGREATGTREREKVLSRLSESGTGSVPPSEKALVVSEI